MCSRYMAVDSFSHIRRRLINARGALHVQFEIQGIAKTAAYIVQHEIKAIQAEPSSFLLALCTQIEADNGSVPDGLTVFVTRTPVWCMTSTETLIPSVCLEIVPSCPVSVSTIARINVIHRRVNATVMRAHAAIFALAWVADNRRGRHYWQHQAR